MHSRACGAHSEVLGGELRPAPKDVAPRWESRFTAVSAEEVQAVVPPQLVSSSVLPPSAGVGGSQSVLDPTVQNLEKD